MDIRRIYGIARPRANLQFRAVITATDSPLPPSLSRPLVLPPSRPPALPLPLPLCLIMRAILNPSIAGPADHTIARVPTGAERRAICERY